MESHEQSGGTAPKQVEELRLSVGATRVAALAWGPEDGQRVLALHGWLDNAASFSGLAAAMPAIRLVALDLPGHGHSEWRPEGVVYHYIDWVYDVLAAADALGWTEFVLMGHSMGAGIGPMVAAAAPQRIERLVLLEGFGPFSCDDTETIDRLTRHLAQRRRESSPPPLYIDEKHAARILMTAAPMLPESAAVLIARGMMAVDGGFTWRSDPRLRWASALRISEGQVLACLRMLTCPVLFVRALNGYSIEASGEMAHRDIAATMAARRASVSSLRYEQVPGKHHVHLDQPKLVGEHVSRFLSAPA